MMVRPADTAPCRYRLIAPRPQLVKVLQITGLGQRLLVLAAVDSCGRPVAWAAGEDTPAG
jgi:hypothetical protein